MSAADELVHMTIISEVSGMFNTKMKQGATAVSDLEEKVLPTQWQTERYVFYVRCHDASLMYNATDTHQLTLLL